MAQEPTAQASITIRGKADYLAGVRELIEAAAAQVGFLPQESQRIVTAAFEAVANAATHGSPLGDRNIVTVDVLAYPDRLVIEVRDQGPAFGDIAHRDMPDVTASRGRGIPLMRALVDEVEFANGDGGKVVLTKYRR